MSKNLSTWFMNDPKRGLTLFIAMFFKVAWPLIKWLSNGNNRWCKTTFMVRPPFCFFHRDGFLIGTKRGSFYASAYLVALQI